MKKYVATVLAWSMALPISIIATQDLDTEYDMHHATKTIPLFTTDSGAACMTSEKLNVHGGTANISTSGFAGSLLINFSNNQSTYTPVLAFGGSSTGITYATTPIGYYCIIGNLVMYSATLTLTSKGSATGNATISLPAYTSIAVFPSNAQLQNVTFSGLTLGTVPASSQLVNLLQCASGGAATNLTDTNFANNSVITISGFYLTS